MDPISIPLPLKAAFHLRVFHTCVQFMYARKSLNLSKFYITIKYLNEYILNYTENSILSFYSIGYSMSKLYNDFNFSVRTRTYEKRVSGMQPL